MSQRLAVLTDTLAALGQAAERLASTHDGVAALFPLDPATFDTLAEPAKERLDAYAIRYARCQDLRTVHRRWAGLHRHRHSALSALSGAAPGQTLQRLDANDWWAGAGSLAAETMGDNPGLPEAVWQTEVRAFRELMIEIDP